MQGLSPLAKYLCDNKHHENTDVFNKIVKCLKIKSLSMNTFKIQEGKPIVDYGVVGDGKSRINIAHLSTMGREEKGHYTTREALCEACPCH